MRILLIALTGLLAASVGSPEQAAARDPVAEALDRAERQLDGGKYDEASDLLDRILGVADSKPNKARGYYLLTRVHLESAMPDTSLAVGHYSKARRYGLQDTPKTPLLQWLESWIPQAAGPAVEPPPVEFPPSDQETVEPAPILPPLRAEPQPAVLPAASPGQTQQPRLPEGGGLPDIGEHTDIGRILEKIERQWYDSLTNSEKFAHIVWTAGIQMAVRKVEQGELDEGRRYAEDVMVVAPEHWAGYYLTAIAYWEEDDRVAARNWWKEVKARNFVPEPGWKDYTAEIEADPEQVFRDYLGYARAMMARNEWIEAEKFLLRTQNIQEELPPEPWVAQELAEVDFMLGQIAYNLQDWHGCMESMDFAEFGGISAARISPIKSRCAEGASRPPPTPTPVVPLPPEFSAYGPYTSVRLDLGRSYLDFEVREVASGGKTGRRARALEESGQFEVQGGRAYRVAINVVGQLRRSALHAVVTALTMSILLL